MPTPETIKLKTQSRILEISFDDGTFAELSCELLRISSPSAEVKGHGPGQEVLQTGKESVNIERIEPVGSYALKLVFDDGHDTGLYTWDYLYQLARHHKKKWQDYLDALEQAGYERKSDE